MVSMHERAAFRRGSPSSTFHAKKKKEEEGVEGGRDWFTNEIGAHQVIGTSKFT